MERPLDVIHVDLMRLFEVGKGERGNARMVEAGKELVPVLPKFRGRQAEVLGKPACVRPPRPFDEPPPLLPPGSHKSSSEMALRTHQPS
jgi:hypothetical protein